MFRLHCLLLSFLLVFDCSAEESVGGQSIWMLIRSWEGGGEVRQSHFSNIEAMVATRRRPSNKDMSKIRIIQFSVKDVIFEFLLPKRDDEDGSRGQVDAIRFPLRALNISVVDFNHSIICRSAITCVTTRSLTTLTTSSEIVSRNWQLSGPINTQKNIVFLSGGYSSDSIKDFYNKVILCIQFLQKGFTDEETRMTVNSQPYKRYFHALNIFSVFEPSLSSGAGHSCEGSHCRDNLWCTYGDEIESELKCNRELTLSTASHSPAYDLIVVIVNNNQTGGTGGNKIAFISSGNDMIHQLAHQLGHADGRLNNEFTSNSDSTKTTTWGSVNCQPETTINSSWKYWQNATANQEWGTRRWELPVTTPHKGCTYSNYQRPTSEGCLMGRSHSEQLCPICLQAMTKEAYNIKEQQDLLLATHQQHNTFDVMAPRCPLPTQEVWLVFGLHNKFSNITLYNRGGISTTVWNDIRNEKYPNGIEDTSGEYEVKRTISTTCSIRDAHNVIIGGIPDCVEGEDRIISGISEHNQMDTITLQSLYLGPGLHTVRYTVVDHSRYLINPITQHSEIVIRVVPHREFLPTQCGGSRESLVHGHVKKCKFSTVKLSDNHTVTNTEWNSECKNIDIDDDEIGDHHFCFSCLESDAKRSTSSISDASDFLISCGNNKTKPTCDINTLSEINIIPPSFHDDDNISESSSAVIATCAVAAIVLFFCLYCWYRYLLKSNIREITPSGSNINIHSHFIFILSGVLMVVSFTSAVLSMWYFTVLSLYGKVQILLCGIIAVIVCLDSYAIFTAAFFKRVRGLLISTAATGVLLLGFLILTIMLFWAERNIETLRDEVREVWLSRLRDDQSSEICDFQYQHQCSGFTTSCQHSSWISCDMLPSECPCGCIYNMNEDPCWNSLKEEVSLRFKDAGTAMTIVDVFLFITTAVTFALYRLVRERLNIWKLQRTERSKLVSGTSLTKIEITTLRNYLEDECGDRTPEMMKTIMEQVLGITIPLSRITKQFLIWDEDRDGKLSDSEIRMSYLGFAQAMKSAANRNLSIFSKEERKLLRNEFRKTNPTGPYSLWKSGFKEFIRSTLAIDISAVEVDYYFYLLKESERDDFIYLEDFFQIYSEVLDTSCVDIISLRSKFYEIDINGDGAIDRTELGIYFQNLIKSNQSTDLSDKQLDYYFHRLDMNEDGRIDFDEFVQAMEVNPLPPPSNDKEIFNYPLEP